jgi:predicted metal-dependent phosphoesterase TrpH
MLNQSLRNRDKLKDDAIAQLSDQLMALSTRLQEIERRQQLASPPDVFSSIETYQLNVVLRYHFHQHLIVF